MKKWYDEEYEFEIKVTGYIRGNKAERYCRNGEEIGDTYTCTYGCPVNQDGQGICSKCMMILYPILDSEVRKWQATCRAQTLASSGEAFP